MSLVWIPQGDDFSYEKGSADEPEKLENIRQLCIEAQSMFRQLLPSDDGATEELFEIDVEMTDEIVEEAKVDEALRAALAERAIRKVDYAKLDTSFRDKFLHPELSPPSDVTTETAVSFDIEPMPSVVPFGQRCYEIYDSVVSCSTSRYLVIKDHATGKEDGYLEQRDVAGSARLVLRVVFVTVGEGSS